MQIRTQLLLDQFGQKPHEFFMFKELYTPTIIAYFPTCFYVVFLFLFFFVCFYFLFCFFIFFFLKIENTTSNSKEKIVCNNFLAFAAQWLFWPVRNCKLKIVLILLLTLYGSLFFKGAINFSLQLQYNMKKGAGQYLHA